MFSKYPLKTLAEENFPTFQPEILSHLNCNSVYWGGEEKKIEDLSNSQINPSELFVQNSSDTKIVNT